MPNLEDCIIRFENSNPTLVRVENTSNNIGIGATPVLPYSKPEPEPEQARGAALSAIRPMTVAEYNNIHANDYKTERNTGSIILIMIVATICLIKVIRAAKKSD